jgi:acyl dehydratase
MTVTMPLEQMTARVGEILGTSEWMRVDQERIDAFAEVTEDRQFIHIDPRAAAQSPFGGTIAHGFLTLSLLSRMVETGLPVPAIRQ